MPAVRYNLATRAMWRIHKALFRLSGGRIGSRIAGHDVLFVTTTGRLSGESRTVGLHYLEVPGTEPVAGSPQTPSVAASGGATSPSGGGNRAYAVDGSFAGEDRDPAGSSRRTAPTGSTWSAPTG